MVWLLSAYRADSHAAWSDWLLATQTDFEWRLLELPGRHFAWRIRGNPLSWLNALPDETPDLVVASSMVDLATLKGLNPRLSHVPTLYYFHENQFAYPAGKNQLRSLEPKMVQLYAALAADRLVFNSAFNRDSFLAGVDGLLKAMPDAVPEGVVERLSRQSTICPVAIEPVRGAGQRRHDPKIILWNHRWEHDKQPSLFTDAMLALADSGVPFRLALLGRRPGQGPEALVRLREALPDRIAVDGMLPRASYRDWLAHASIAVSTSAHEFQGLSMLEAASAGARPLVPDALCYPELYPAPYRYSAGCLDALVARLTAWITEELPAPVDVSPWYSQRLIPGWNALLRELL